MNRMWIRLSIIYALTIFVLTSLLPLIIFYAPIESNFFTISSQGDLSEADIMALEQLKTSDAWGTILRNFATIPILAPIIMLSIAGAITSILASWWITRPLITLEDGTRKIATGDTSHRVKIEGTSEIVSLAQSFNLMIEALEKAETQRQNLLADVSHELRTPLTVLQGHLRGILDDIYTFDKEEIAKLYEQTQHLNHLVNDLHDIAQAEAHRLTFDMKGIDLSSIVQQVVGLFEPIAQEAGIELNVQIEGTLPIIRSDKQRLIQVLQNLISNNLRYAKSKIDISLSQQMEQIVLVMQDDGEGIDAEKLPHIFDRFYRANTSRNRQTDGTGLGLAIVKSIIEALGGDISATSHINQGTIFTIIIPTIPNIKAR